MSFSRIRAGKLYWLASESVDATGTNASSAVGASEYIQGSFQVVHSGHTAGTSTWEVQGSNDGTNWDTVASSSTTTSGATGSATVVMDPVPNAYLRVKITAANATPGAAYTVYFLGRRAG